MIQNEGQYYSLNNRRLYLFKHLRSVGALTRYNNTIKVYTKDALPREKKRYTPDNCSLTAKIMGVATVGGTREEVDDDGSDDVDNDGGSQDDECEDTKAEADDDEGKDKDEDKGDKPAANAIGTITIITTAGIAASSSRKTTTTTSSSNSSKPKKTEPLSKEVLEGIKALTKLFKKNKLKAVNSQIEEWLEGGELEENQVEIVRAQIGFGS